MYSDDAAQSTSKPVASQRPYLVPQPISSAAFIITAGIIPIYIEYIHNLSNPPQGPANDVTLLRFSIFENADAFKSTRQVIRKDNHTQLDNISRYLPVSAQIYIFKLKSNIHHDPFVR